MTWIQITRALTTTAPNNMPPIYDKPTVNKYDYVLIGGGSGGSASSVRSSWRVISIDY